MIIKKCNYRFIITKLCRYYKIDPTALSIPLNVKKLIIEKYQNIHILRKFLFAIHAFYNVYQISNYKLQNLIMKIIHIKSFIKFAPKIFSSKLNSK